MKLIVGIGNPGSQYEGTRHNAGWMALDRVAARHAAGAIPKARFHASAVDASIRGEKCLLLKPTTYVNLSGRCVAEAVSFFKLDHAADLLVLVDDVALPCGAIRIRPLGGAGGHNGLADIQRALGSDRYPRLRIGIDPSPPFMDQADWVLGRFTAEQRELVEPALDAAADAVETFAAEGIDAAMNRFNAKASGSGADTRPPEAPGPKEGDAGTGRGWGGHKDWLER